MPDDEADRLYGLPLEEFTDARNARARELKKAGDPDAAEAVRGLAKPTRAAWAVNQLARSNRKEVDALLQAGQRLRSAHEKLLEGKGGEAVGKASAAEREAVARLVERARRMDLSAAALERVAQTLHAAAASEEVREQVSRGVLTTEHQAAMFGGLGGAAAPAPRRAAKGRAEDKQRRDDDARAERERRELLKAARAELTKLRSEHGKAQRALDTAERRLARAREELEGHERDAASAREREAQARSAAAGAEEEVGRLEG